MNGPHRVLTGLGSALAVSFVLVAARLPPMGDVLERARSVEAQDFAGQFRAAQKAYRLRHGKYARGLSQLAEVDPVFKGPAPTYGMRYYEAVFGQGEPLRLTLRRVTDRFPVAWGTPGARAMIYDLGSDRLMTARDAGA